MDTPDYQREAKRQLVIYLDGKADSDSIFIVWFAKTLQNWKALLSTTLPDEMYYELTYNGDKSELYIDAYRKIENTLVHL